MLAFSRVKLPRSVRIQELSGPNASNTVEGGARQTRVQFPEQDHRIAPVAARIVQIKVPTRPFHFPRVIL